MTQKITMKQIATEAGVSLTTVSNVINHKANRVSEDKKQEILSLIKKYDYSPNFNARALANSSTKLIGLLYYSKDWNINFSDPFVSEILEGMEQVAKENGYFTLVHNVTNEDDIALIQNSWNFEGFVIVGVTKTFFDKVNEKLKTPVVYVDTHVPQATKEACSAPFPHGFVNSDDYESAENAVDYLVGLGHKKIAFLTHQKDVTKSDVIEKRYLGFKSALQKNGCTFDDTHFYTPDEFDRLQMDIGKFSAIVTTADLLAMELIHHLKKEENTQHLSIISFDDIKYASFSSPPLTTIRLEQITKGSISMQMLIDFIEAPTTKNLKEYIHKGTLIIRESCFEYHEDL